MRKRNGFTLTEMLIALMILVIISSMVTVIFRATQQSFTNARAFQHVIDLARQTIFRIHNELASVYIERSGMINLVPGLSLLGFSMGKRSASRIFCHLSAKL